MILNKNLTPKCIKPVVRRKTTTTRAHAHTHARTHARDRPNSNFRFVVVFSKKKSKKTKARAVTARIKMHPLPYQQKKILVEASKIPVEAEKVILLDQGTVKPKTALHGSFSRF